MWGVSETRKAPLFEGASVISAANPAVILATVSSSSNGTPGVVKSIGGGVAVSGPDLYNSAYSPRTNTTAAIDTTREAMDMAVSNHMAVVYTVN